MTVSGGMAGVTDGPKVGHLQAARWILGDGADVIDFRGPGTIAMGADLTGP
jgi:hypothetical protein